MDVWYKRTRRVCKHKGSRLIGRRRKAMASWRANFEEVPYDETKEFCYSCGILGHATVCQCCRKKMCRNCREEFHFFGLDSACIYCNLTCRVDYATDASPCDVCHRGGHPFTTNNVYGCGHHLHAECSGVGKYGRYCPICVGNNAPVPNPVGPPRFLYKRLQTGQSDSFPPTRHVDLLQLINQRRADRSSALGAAALGAAAGPGPLAFGSSPAPAPAPAPTPAPVVSARGPFSGCTPPKIKGKGTCSVCLETYTDPCMATCGHSCCYECWVSIDAAKDAYSSTFGCPKCRASLTMGQIFRNFALIEDED